MGHATEKQVITVPFSSHYTTQILARLGFFWNAGGEGLFNTVVKGPGHIIVQTMPIQKTAMAIDPFITKTTVSTD